MFDIRQTAEETLKQFLNRFTNISMRLIDPNEGLLVKAFMKGLRASSFGESLYRYPPKGLTEIRQRAAVEIETEEAMCHKKAGDKKPVTHVRSERDMRPYRRERTPPKMKTNRRFVPYVAQRSTDHPQMPGIPNLKVPMAQVLEDVEIARHLRYPDVAGRTLGNRLDAWCEFHQTRGHGTNYCYGLRYQLSVLANRGLLTKFMKTDAEEKSSEVRTAPDIHETPILGDFNTIAGGFSGGGQTSSARKRYARSVMTTAVMDKPRQAPDITFSNDDLKGVVPHEDDPIVVSVIMMGRNVHRVLIDQGSSADVMFWNTFIGLQIPIDQLKSFDGVLVGFSGDQVEVKGYVDLRTTFRDKEDAKTVFVRYIVVNTPSSYNLLLGRPSLNKLRAVISTIHLKMKFPSDEGKVLTLAVNQETARKCYEDSLRLRRKVAYSVSTAGVVLDPELDPRLVHPERRPQPVGEVKEVLIDGKKLRIGGDLSQEQEQQLIQVLKRNLSSFAWSVTDMSGIDPDFLCHKLNINPSAKPKVQKRRRLSGDRAQAATEEIHKLLEAAHIREIQYPTWLANVVMVKKSNGRWRMCVDFTDLNNSCPKDSYPLPNIDALVDNASGCALLSFLDAYSGYNQIKMHWSDEDKTAFMGGTANYCYRVMPFGLKNAGATYQRLMDRILAPMLGRNVYAYVDDMVVTSVEEKKHEEDLEELFATISKYRLKLNPEKCVFGVRAGKFLGFLLTERGIEANPDKCAAIVNMRSPSNVKEVQRLTGRMAALSRFLAKSGDRGFPYFQCLKKNERFQWTDQCEEAFQRLKEYLSKPPVLCKPEKGSELSLYISVTEHAVSSVLVREGDGEQKPVYFVSKVLHGAEARYPTIEKAALAVVVSARRLRYYFQNHAVKVMTDLPIRYILQKPDISGRLVKWAIELSEYGLQYESRGPIKAQFLADFVVELSEPPVENQAVGKVTWILSVDGASNLRGSGAGIVLEGPEGVLIEQSLRFAFKASNNQAEYEALIAGMLLAKGMGVTKLLVKSDSALVAGQVNGEFQARDPQLAKYLEVVQAIAKNFVLLEFVHVPREQNSRADLLSKLASCSKPGQHKSVIRETLIAPRIDVQEEHQVLEISGTEESWMAPFKSYLADGKLPKDSNESQKIKKNSSRYTLIDGHLFRYGYSRPLLICVGRKEADRLMAELHEGICGSHVGGRALMLRITRGGFFWPTMKGDCIEYVRKCESCQKHADWSHAPPEILHSISTPWPFHTWGIDILGPFPKAVKQFKFLIVAVEYFTKWIEAEPVAVISGGRIREFIWKNIICRFGVPHRIISDNGTQFACSQVKQLCEEIGIKQVFSSVEHPQTNGQAEAANRVILRGLKRRLVATKGEWPNEVPRVLWAYHTTPQTTTRETPFSLVYGTDAMIPIEVMESTGRVRLFDEEISEVGLRANLDVIDEVRDLAQISNEAMKRRLERSYRTKVVPRKFQELDLVLRKAQLIQMDSKLAPKWTGPYRVKQVLREGAYKLETLEGKEIPRTWNAANLRFYFS